MNLFLDFAMKTSKPIQTLKMVNPNLPLRVTGEHWVRPKQLLSRWRSAFTLLPKDKPGSPIHSTPGKPGEVCLLGWAVGAGLLTMVVESRERKAGHRGLPHVPPVAVVFVP